ncbi:HPGDS [Bugula neritina]|uniref:HPGDS n=1 Tax=Bugula neritina TaxID=10212 RepID=A0A7J7KMR2_BUGNE|nr:HPGDS [Bugula neritina]
MTYCVRRLSTLLLNFKPSQSIPALRKYSSVSEDKLLYFAFRGRGEPIRIIYALAQVPLKDERVPISLDHWMNIKKDQPLGQLPVLTCSEGTLVQSKSIARYAAKKFGLAGKSIWEEALSDMIIETCDCSFGEIGAKIVPWKYLKSEPKPANHEQVLADVKEKIIQTIEFIQKGAEERGKRFIISDEISLGDVMFYSSLEVAAAVYPDLMKYNSWVEDFVLNFISDDRISKYLASRPQSQLPI